MRKLLALHNLHLLKRTLPFLLIVLTGVGMYFFYKTTVLSEHADTLSSEKSQLEVQFASSKKELEMLKSVDQFKRNEALQEELVNIQRVYKKAVGTYENLLSLKEQTTKTQQYDELLSESLALLSERNYGSAEAVLNDLQSSIEKQKQTIASEFSPPKNVPVNNSPPSGGYSRQQVKTEIGTYLVDIVSADLGSTRVIVDTASDSDCHDNCPVLPLADYVVRNGAFAGINGSYFCPASYPTCVGKTNSFDTLLMNKNKKYFNSDNNVYSTVPAVIFLGGSVRYVGRSLEWGRDTGIDSMIANQPLLLSGGNISFTGSGDPKQGSKGSRSFVGSKGTTVYIGVVHNATVAEVAIALKAMGLDGALNLDSGGSTALWHGGYKAGPGRNIPNAILFIRR